ncbi:MAG: hypothetical protein KGY38_08635 [Desulfobacterales bacterium]|nr:hypothetical protein [Desulfobacterales bacterium]
MVKQRKKNNRKKPTSKEFKKNRARARKINASTGFDTCTEQLSPFGGLLGLIKFLDLVDFAEIFDFAYIAPRRDPKLAHYSMVVGILMLLFIGFNRILSFCICSTGCHALRIFQVGEAACGQHILAVC